MRREKKKKREEDIPARGEEEKRGEGHEETPERKTGSLVFFT